MPRAQRTPGLHVHYLSLGQAALVSGIDRAMLRTLVRKKVLPTVRIPGGAWHLVSRAAVLAIKRQLDAGLEMCGRQRSDLPSRCERRSRCDDHSAGLPRIPAESI